MGVVDIALAEEGTKEASGKNDVKYNDWYYGRHVSGGSYPWCAVFVSWCMNQAGVPGSIVPKTASVSTLYSFFRNAGLFQPKGNGYRPKPGDIMIQKSGGASHTGIVYASDNSKFYTIEGNSSNKVQKRSYSYSDSKLTGFGTPNYDGSVLSGNPDMEDTPINTGSGSAVGNNLGVGHYDYTAYTVQEGDTIEDIANRFKCTVDMILFANNLTSMDLRPGQSLNVPTASRAYDDPVGGTIVVDKKHTVKVEVSHPTVKAEFFGEYGRLAAVGELVESEKHLDDDIISISTVRNMGQDCPTFSISLVWRNSWYQNLSSNDLVIIYLQRPPEAMKAVFFGLIDDIRKVTDFSSGQPQRAVQVTGRGFNKALVNFDVGLIENVSVDTGTGFFANFMLLGNCNSYDAISLILDSYIGKAIKYSFGNGQLFEDYFYYGGNKQEWETLINYMSYTSYNGSLWNFIKELGNAPFNETYWEVQEDLIGDCRPSLIHRRTPFTKEDWIALPYHVIPDCDIVSDNTGRSDLETYTLYSVQMSVGEEALTNMYPPLWYPPYYAKYGLTQLEVITNYQIQSDDYDSAMGSLYQQLFDFNIKNNVFSNGTIVVKGKACYRVGERIVLESDGMEYYVESVTHTFNCFGAWTTSLGVTRGIQPDQRFTAPVGCAEELTPEVMNAIISQTSGEQIDWSNLPTYSGAGNEIYQGIDTDADSLLNTTTDYDASTGVPAENEMEVFNTLKSWGMNTAAAAAVLANINAESGFRTDAWGDNHTSLGLCQWHNSRCTNLQNYCKNNGYSVTSVQGQMAYLKYELQNSYKGMWDTLMSCSDDAQGAYDAAYAWCVDFERPKNKEQKGRERGNSAKNTYYKRYVNGVSGGDGSWLDCVQTVKSMLAATGLKYSQSIYTTYQFDGFNVRVHPDCSGTVTAMIAKYQGRALSQMSSTNITDKASIEGFRKLNWPGWNGLQQGDIIARHGHVEVFSHNSGNSHFVWNAGSNKSVASASPTVSSHDSYTTVWRAT